MADPVLEPEPTTNLKPVGEPADRDIDYATVTETPGRGALRETLDALRTRYSLAADLGAGGDVLELACGPGMGLAYLARSARKVVGGDFDAGLVEQARAHYGDRFEIRQIDAADLPFGDGSFDLVLLLEAIYYLPDPGRFLREARRVLRPGGAVLICSANPEREDFNPSPFTHRYFSAGELATLLGECGFGAELAAAFPVTAAGAGGRLYAQLRNLAVKWHLIPKTMAGKELIKKILYRNLTPFPAELTVEGSCVPLETVDAGQPVTGYKVIYATGWVPAASSSR